RRGRRPEKGASRKVRTGGADHLTAIVYPARLAARRARQGSEVDHAPRRSVRDVRCPEEGASVRGVTAVGIATADHLPAIVDAESRTARPARQCAEIGHRPCRAIRHVRRPEERVVDQSPADAAESDYLPATVDSGGCRTGGEWVADENHCAGGRVPQERAPAVRV